jgi:hypothetical protein
MFLAARAPRGPDPPHGPEVVEEIRRDGEPGQSASPAVPAVVGPEPSPDFDGDRRGDPGVVEADVLPAAVFQPVPPVLGRRFVALGIRIDVDGPVADLDREGPTPSAKGSTVSPQEISNRTWCQWQVRPPASTDRSVRGNPTSGQRLSVA